MIDVDTFHGLLAYLSDPSRITNISFERKYIGSGVYRCGECGGPMRVQYAGAGRGQRGVRVYACRAFKHVIRSGEPVDEFVTALVLERLRRSDIHQLLRDGNRVNVAELRTRRAALQARLDDLAAMFAAGDIDASQLRRGTEDLRVQLSGVDSVLAEVARTSPVVDLVAAGDALKACWDGLSADLKSKVVDELMTVTVLEGAARHQGISSRIHPHRVEDAVITIYCDDPSHPEKCWEFSPFIRINEAWVRMPPGFSGDHRRLLGHSTTMTRLTGDRYMPREEAAPDYGAIRHRPNLKCRARVRGKRRCGLAFERRDTPVLFAVLDRCERAGLERISLRNLIKEAAIIEGSTE